MAEWSKAAVLKTAVGQPTRGSNPFASATTAPGAPKRVPLPHRRYLKLSATPAILGFGKHAENIPALVAIGVCDANNSYQIAALTLARASSFSATRI